MLTCGGDLTAPIPPSSHHPSTFPSSCLAQLVTHKCLSFAWSFCCLHPLSTPCPHRRGKTLVASRVASFNGLLSRSSHPSASVPAQRGRAVGEEQPRPALEAAQSFLNLNKPLLTHPPRKGQAHEGKAHPRPMTDGAGHLCDRGPQISAPADSAVPTTSLGPPMGDAWLSPGRASAGRRIWTACASTLLTLQLLL